jgi:flagellar biogenesis protein FliO
MFSLLIVGPLMAILLVGWLVSRRDWRLRLRMRYGSGPLLEVVGRTQLTPSASVHLLRVDGRLMLISAHASGCCLLARWQEDSAARGRSCGAS